MKDEEVWYYMRQIRQKAQNLYESYVQVMEVIKENADTRCSSLIA